MLTALGFYWPAIFVATHIPNPGKIVGTIGMSDKTMHFLAYLALVSLVWFSVSPFEKVKWAKAKVWIILATIVWYGAFDEWLQKFVGRQPDVFDFCADIGAAFTALIILTFLSFWPAVLALAAIFIFSITCLASPQITLGNEYANSAFYFLSYSFFTLVWIQCSERFWNIKKTAVKWTLMSLGIPIAALAAMTIISPLFGKDIWPMNIITALTAITAATAITCITTKISQKKYGAEI
jgi:hypothetical protein